jgi:hypothetical protein
MVLEHCKHANITRERIGRSVDALLIDWPLKRTMEAPRFSRSKRAALPAARFAVAERLRSIGHDKAYTCLNNVAIEYSAKISAAFSSLKSKEPLVELGHVAAMSVQAPVADQWAGGGEVEAAAEGLGQPEGPATPHATTLHCLAHQVELEPSWFRLKQHARIHKKYVAIRRVSMSIFVKRRT